LAAELPRPCMDEFGFLLSDETITEPESSTFQFSSDFKVEVHNQQTPRPNVISPLALSAAFAHFCQRPAQDSSGGKTVDTTSMTVGLKPLLPVSAPNQHSLTGKSHDATLRNFHALDPSKPQTVEQGPETNLYYSVPDADSDLGYEWDMSGAHVATHQPTGCVQFIVGRSPRIHLGLVQTSTSKIPNQANVGAAGQTKFQEKVRSFANRLLNVSSRFTRNRPINGLDKNQDVATLLVKQGSDTTTSRMRQPNPIALRRRRMTNAAAKNQTAMAELAPEGNESRRHETIVESTYPLENITEPTIVTCSKALHEKHLFLDPSHLHLAVSLCIVSYSLLTRIYKPVV